MPGTAKSLLVGEATGTLRRRRGALAHLLLAIMEPVKAVRTGAVTDAATTTMDLCMCSTVKTMLVPMVGTMQDLKDVANVVADGP